MTMTNASHSRIKIRLVCQLAYIFLFLVSRVSGYASWLKCFVDLDDSEVIMNYEVVPFEDAIHKVRVQIRRDTEGSPWTTNSIHYAGDGTETVLRIKLNVPKELTQRDVQYVVEASKGAAFTTRSMCEGSRSHALNHDVENVLVIDGSQPKVELWAGWATGHEPVHLTEKIVLYREGEGAATDSEGEL